MVLNHYLMRPIKFYTIWHDMMNANFKIKSWTGTIKGLSANIKYVPPGNVEAKSKNMCHSQIFASQ